eukprot:Amastigsp_a180152_6.p5 type:complete len:110 gc:universal Amastigsp_a180152_6:362-33(-)
MLPEHKERMDSRRRLLGTRVPKSHRNHRVRVHALQIWTVGRESPQLGVERSNRVIERRVHDAHRRSSAAQPQERKEPDRSHHENAAVSHETAGRSEPETQQKRTVYSVH